VVFERDLMACGASVRNFGMLWPIGQPAGKMREMALRSLETWLSVLHSSELWHERTPVPCIWPIEKMKLRSCKNL
jgi:hypothetical protein